MNEKKSNQNKSVPLMSVESLERNGHTLVIGTTRAGKTPLPMISTAAMTSPPKPEDKSS